MHALKSTLTSTGTRDNDHDAFRPVTVTPTLHHLTTKIKIQGSTIRSTMNMKTTIVLQKPSIQIQDELAEDLLSIKLTPNTTNILGGEIGSTVIAPERFLKGHHQQPPFSHRHQKSFLCLSLPTKFIFNS